MSNDRRHTASIEQPVDGTVKAPATPLPAPVREGRDGGVARRRHALRIPDDEVSRPQLSGAGARAAPPSDPVMPPEPAPVVKPTRIITISEPPPAPDADVSESSTSRATPQGPIAAALAPFDDDEGLEVSMGPEGDEVEVRFDDDFPAAPTPASALEEPPATADPARSPELARGGTEPVGAAVELAENPEEPSASRAPVEPPFAEPARAPMEAARAPAEPAVSSRAPAEPPRPSVELARTPAEAAHAAVAASPVRTEEALQSSPDLAGEAEGEADVLGEPERRSHPSDAPEVAAEDVVTLEPPPVRPMSALPPMRPRAMSQPASQQFVTQQLVSQQFALQQPPLPQQQPALPQPTPPQPPLPQSTSPQPAPLSVLKPPRIPTPRTSLVIVPPHVGSMPSQQDGPATRRKIRLWWEELFNDDYLRATEKIGDDQLKQEVSFIEESLGVERGGALLDLACGTGRHAIELARRGYEVVGFDLSLAMLARAGEEAQDLGAKLNFVQGDMREMTFEEQFDGVYCWSTSFGYFEEDKNSQVVARIGRALKAGGTFLLDVANRDFLVRQSPSLAWFEGDGCVCMDEMNLDFITSRLKVKRTMMLDDGRSREIEYSMRVYSLHELGKILHEHGFKVREVSGRLATPGVFFGNESPRAIILAEKK
ncbi:MAG TPA: methyltransferase domain-containing protein [Polyangiaceae bacterium]|nr:methyltransferase domain-containing protein [Polyangiaceae bacterium]